MRIAVLSLQGAFIEHERMLRSLGADVFEVRELADWHQPKDGLVLPGGESTTQAKLLGDLNLLDPIRADIEALATVDGHIVAARQGNQLVTAFHPELDTDTRVHAYFMDMMR